VNDARTHIDGILGRMAELHASNLAAAPKLPRLSYKQRRASWAAMGKTGEDAHAAMQRELDREPYRKVICDKSDCPVCGP
jgi:hypothetical protein